MRLDKFVGKADYHLRINVYDWVTNNKLFCIPSGEYYGEFYEKMLGYKVKYYKVENNVLEVYAKKKED